jgi:hypothetical protein
MAKSAKQPLSFSEDCSEYEEYYAMKMNHETLEKEMAAIPAATKTITVHISIQKSQQAKQGENHE